MAKIKTKKTTNPSKTNKTKMVSFRVPNELAEQIPQEGKTEWLLDAIRGKLSKEPSKKINIKPRTGIKYAEIVTPKGTFKTQVEAASAYGCAKRTFSDWLRNTDKPEIYGVTLDGSIIGK